MCGGAWNLLFSLASPVMPVQVARGPHFEKHCCLETFSIVRIPLISALVDFHATLKTKAKGQKANSIEKGWPMRKTCGRGLPGAGMFRTGVPKQSIPGKGLDDHQRSWSQE